MTDLQQDIRYALRVLARNPGFTLVVVLALALGIGANTAIYTTIDAVLLRPLPYEEPERLVKIWGHFAGIGVPKDQNWISAPEFVDIRDQNRSFSHAAAIDGGSFNIKVDSVPERVEGASVSADFFALLGVQAAHGRMFLPGEDKPGRENVVVLGHGLWERRLGADRSVLGKPLPINGRPYLVVGIAPPRFAFPPEAEIWTPLAFSKDDLTPNNRGSHGLEVIARIKSGLSLDQAKSDMQAVTQRVIEQNPNYHYSQFQFRFILNPLLDEIVGDIGPALWILLGAVGFVLLIACANVANLLLARATAREREMAIRTALGAGRARLIRQLLTESCVLALMGATVGLLLARWGLNALIGLGSTSIPRIAGAQLNLKVLGFTILIALFTGILFGLAPALQAFQVNPESLKEGGRGMTSGTASRTLRHTLVVVEVALSLILLVGAGLLLRSLFQLQKVDPGFRSEDVLTLRLALPQTKYSQPSQVWSFFRDLVERTSKLPGVEAVGGVTSLPLSGSGSSGTTTVDSHAVSPQDASPEADWRIVTPDYFRAMGVSLIRGRYFDDRDAENAAPVAIIDETMANTYWPGEDPIGKRLKRGGARSSNPWMTIVGVVKHVRYRTLEAQSRVQLYWPYAQNPWPFMSLVLRTSMEPRSLATAVQKEVLGIDPDQPVYSVRTMQELLSDSISRRRFSMLLLAIFAGVALLLAAIGIYGVMSYTVTQRAHEMGIRIALGAGRLSVLRLVLGQSLSIALAGMLVGVAGSFTLARLIAGLLFSVRATDPATFVSVAVFLFVVALVASLLPAWRATQVDPMVVLRYE